MAGELQPKTFGEKTCSDPIIVGQPSFNYDWVLKPSNDDVGQPQDIILQPECIPWYYYNMRVGSIYAQGPSPSIFATGDIVSNNGAHVLSGKKNLPFDMPHPNKKGWRLRHVCIEGPEIAVYCRGKVPSDGIINLPSFWEGLVNVEDMSISLTPIGSWQELFVKEVRWGKQVIVRNNASGSINADYYIVARRLDDDLIVEYEGETYQDYPGGNEGYSFNYEHDYVENLIKDTIKKTVVEIKENSNG